VAQGSDGDPSGASFGLTTTLNADHIDVSDLEMVLKSAVDVAMKNARNDGEDDSRDRNNNRTTTNSCGATAGVKVASSLSPSLLPPLIEKSCRESNRRKQSCLSLFQRPEDAAWRVTVENPSQRTDDRGKRYTVFTVKVEADADADNGWSESSGDGRCDYAVTTVAFRRYGDFLWLREQLKRNRPGAMLPPLPDRRAMNRFEPSFLEERRAGLELFLRRCHVSSEFRNVGCLRQFLTAHETVFRAAIHAQSNSDVDKEEEEGGGVYVNGLASSGMSTARSPVLKTIRLSPEKKKRTSKLMTWLTNRTTAISGCELVPSPDDCIFEDAWTYTTNLEKSLKNAYSQASCVTKLHNDLSSGWYDFGKALTLLRIADKEGQGVPAGLAGDAICSCLGDITADTTIPKTRKLEKDLLDHLKAVQMLREAMQTRHEHRLSYTAALKSITAKRDQLNKLRLSAESNPKSQTKIADAETNLRNAQESAESVRADYDIVSKRVLREMDRFKKESLISMQATFGDLCILQQEYHAEIGNFWAGASEQLCDMELSTRKAFPPALEVQENDFPLRESKEGNGQLQEKEAYTESCTVSNEKSTMDGIQYQDSSMILATV